MTRTILLAATLLGPLGLVPGQAQAQGQTQAQARPAVPPRPATPASATPASATPASASPAAAPAVPATPQQTTASFGDWTLRCSRVGPAPGTQVCEVGQGIQREDRPVAQIALGHPAKGQKLTLTVLVPPNVGFAVPATLLPPRDGDGAAVEMAWRRCLPGGCTADAALADEAVARIRGWAEPARITLQDAAGRPAVLPFSPRGLAQALDALAKEE